jgi:acetoin utilization deacetylase AcuC-like enzyme
MTTALLTHPDCADHLTPPGHPEQVARLDAVLSALDGADLLHVTAPLAAEDDLLRVHPRAYLDSIRKASPAEGWAALDPDTHLSPGSVAAAFRGAGAAIRAVDMVMSGEAANAFCATRPPGHHAERETAMGFCFFGNVAAAALHALDHHGLSRVAIVDFDVHHGNGTQNLVEDDPRVLFCSSHQMPLYPGTGEPADTGPHDTVVNVALPGGADGRLFRAAMEREVLPRIDAFAPELILISAGFDAHADDPLAGLRLTEADFAWITGRLCDLATRHAGGKVVSCLEGGYDLDALGRSARAHVDVLIERGTGG